MALVFTHEPYCTGPLGDGPCKWTPPRMRSASPPQPSFTTRQREMGARPLHGEQETMGLAQPSDMWVEWSDEMDDNPATLPPSREEREVVR